jgi:hypothetical protein
LEDIGESDLVIFSVIRIHHGNAAAARTPTVSFASTSPKGLKSGDMRRAEAVLSVKELFLFDIRKKMVSFGLGELSRASRGLRRPSRIGAYCPAVRR